MKNLDRKRQRAHALLQAGRLEEARTAYRSLCSKTPKDIDALMNLAAIAGQLGHYGETEACCRQAIDLQPKLAVAHALLGIALAAQGRGTEGLGAFEQAAALAPTDLMVNYNYGKALADAGRHEDALARYEQALKTAVDAAPVRHAMGLSLTRLGRLEEAAANFTRTLEMQPGNPDALLGLSDVCWRLGNATDTMEHCRSALASRPDFAEAYSNLGLALGALGRWGEAVEAFQKAIRLKPDFALAYSHLGDAEVVRGNVDDAKEAYGEALRRDPDLAAALAGQANILDIAGDPQAAYELLEPVVRRGGAHPTVVTAFADASLQLRSYDEAIAQIRKMLANPAELTPWQRSGLLFRLGALQERIDHYDEAFESYRLANDGYPTRFDPQAHVRTVDAIITTWSSARLEQSPKATLRSERPVFIVGMPRSGTTLVEQILATHPDVFGAGERAEVGNLADASGASHDSVAADRLDAAMLDRFAATYLDNLGSIAGDARRITDKMPSNFLHLWFIALTFPGARVIHCTRDPRDTCLSLYAHGFSGNHDYAYRLDHLAEYYLQYQRLMDHWKTVLEIPIFEVCYEDLVSDLERETRALLSFCDLSWHEACLRPDETQRAVVTTSYSQVREPVHRGRIGRWSRYAEQLKPLIERLDAG